MPNDVCLFVGFGAGGGVCACVRVSVCVVVLGIHAGVFLLLLNLASLLLAGLPVLIFVLVLATDVLLDCR